MSKKFEMLQNKGTLNVSLRFFLHSFSKKLWLSLALLKKNSTNLWKTHLSPKVEETSHKLRRLCNHRSLVRKINDIPPYSSLPNLDQPILSTRQGPSKRWTKTSAICLVTLRPNSHRAVSCRIELLNFKSLLRSWLQPTRQSERPWWLLVTVAVRWQNRKRSRLSCARGTN